MVGMIETVIGCRSNVSGRKGDPSPRKELIGMDAQQRSGATVSIQQEDSIVNLDEGADSATLKMAQNAKAPRIWCALAFIFPPLGWVGFVIHRKWPKNTPRGKWAHRACAIGSLLAFLYTFVAAALVGHYGQNSPNENGYKGCGFGGPCPPFSGPNALQLK